MAKYPVKMLKDEQNQPFVPLVSAESIYTNDDLSFEEKFATKLEADNLKEGNGIILEQNGNDTTISVDFGATDNIIDNLNTTVAGQGPLDARQGNVLKNMIPVIVDSLDSTDATKVLSANQGHELKEMSVPTGGATGQVLKKASDNDHELEWGDAADPNAIVGDGSIMKIVELTYAEYKTLESNSQLREDTEYHIIDVENGTASYMTQDQIQSQIDSAVSAAIQSITKNNQVTTFEFDDNANYQTIEGYNTIIVKNGWCTVRCYMRTITPATAQMPVLPVPAPLIVANGMPHWEFHTWEAESSGIPLIVVVTQDGQLNLRKGVEGCKYFINIVYPIAE